MLGALLALLGVGAAVAWASGGNECKWTVQSVQAWLYKWQAQSTIVLDEATAAGAAGLDLSAMLGAYGVSADYAILLRADGTWLFGITNGPNAGWWEGEGYMADYCADKPPGDHLADGIGDNAVGWQ
jgi:hypothetical protein